MSASNTPKCPECGAALEYRAGIPTAGIRDEYVCPVHGTVDPAAENVLREEHYRCIVADPPWTITKRLGRGGRRRNETVVPYSMMTVDEIASLDVDAAAATDCVLFLWATRKVFREGGAASVAREWGFEPCGEIIWGLPNVGTGSPPFGNDHEPVLVAKRGRPRITHEEYLGVWFWKQVYEYGPAGVPQKKHSAKPPGFFELVEQITDGPRLELFAREARLGWDSWGDQSLGHVELAPSCYSIPDKRGDDAETVTPVSLGAA